MKIDEYHQFENVFTQIEALYDEIGNLSKKSPNDAVNNFKLTFINKALEETNKLLGEKDKPFKDFNFFDVDNLPTNSDIVMILSVYLNCLEKLRCENIDYNPNDKQWYWKIDGRRNEISTTPPRQARK